MGSSSFKKTEQVLKAATTQGGDTGPSPNQADGRQFRPGSVSSPAPAPSMMAPTLASGMYPTSDGAIVPVSPNDSRRGWPNQQLRQPEGYYPGGGEGAVSGKRQVAGGYGTTDGAVIPTSPNQGEMPPAWADREGSNPQVSGGNLPNGATNPTSGLASLARKGMGSGSETPVMARGIPPMARIASGDLRRGQMPMEADVARPSGGNGLSGLASFARGKGGVIPLDPKVVSGKKQAPTTWAPGQSATNGMAPASNPDGGKTTG